MTKTIRKEKEIKFPKFGSNLRWLRLSKKLTQEKLCDEIDVKRGAYTMWEGGFSRPNPVDEKKIATFYNINVDDLYNANISNGERKRPQSLPDEKKPTEVGGDLQNKYVALLEQQAAMAKEIGIAAARSTAQELAANFASKADQEEDHTMIEALQLFVVRRFVKIGSGSLEHIARELSDTVDEVRREKVDQKQAAIG